MKNALVEEMQAAYFTHKLWPIRFTNFLLGFSCPLTALAISRGVVNKNDPRLELDRDENPAIAWACTEFGAEWVAGIIDAFDGDEESTDDPSYLAGYECGSQALEEFFPRY